MTSFLISAMNLRNMFRAQTNIGDGAFCEYSKLFSHSRFILNYRNSLHLQCLTGFWIRLWIFRCIKRKQPPEVFYEKGALKNFAKFTGKFLCQSLVFNKVAGLRPVTLLKKRLWHRCFSVNFSKFLRTLFLQNTSGRLFLFLLIVDHPTVNNKKPPEVLYKKGALINFVISAGEHLCCSLFLIISHDNAVYH